jgi:hypothetical protein
MYDSCLGELEFSGVLKCRRAESGQYFQQVGADARAAARMRRLAA